MRFASPWMLLLLALVPVWLWRMRLATRRGGLQYAAVNETMMPRSFWARFGPSLLIGLRGAALVLLIIALARPQIGKSETKIRSEGIEIALAVDVSGSMQAMDFEQDGQPVDRLTIVKQAVKEFINARPNDRIGMIAFAGRAYVASPLTLDHDWLERNLDRVKVGLIEDGTAIGAGLGTAVNRLRDTKAKSRVVILLTDGVNNVQEVPPMEAAKAAKEFGVRVYTIGAGTMGLAPMPVMNRAGQVMGFQRVQVQIDEDLLTEIAKMTGGQYFRATDTDSLRRIYQQIDQMEKQQIETVKFEEWSELFAWALGPGLGCLLLAVLMEHTRLRRLP